MTVWPLDVGHTGAMAGKYKPLTDLLNEVAARGQQEVELDFAQIAGLVGGLPASASSRSWWANNSQGQALAWRAADFHVEQVYLDRQRVRFAAGMRGGSYHDRGRIPAVGYLQSDRVQPSVTIGEPLDVRIRLQWLDSGPVKLDAQGKLAFVDVERTAGIYRLTLEGAEPGGRRRVYIGETDNLRRRLHANYRSPGPSQQTSLRINQLLREHLGAGGSATVAVATAATVWLTGQEQPLDLTRKAGRLLAESAALVVAQVTDDADIANFG